MTAQTEQKNETLAKFILMTCPEKANRWLDLDHSFESWGDPSVASETISECSRGLALSDVSPSLQSDLYIARGRGYLRIQQYERAADDFAQALLMESDNELAKYHVSETYWECGLCLVETGKYHEAIRVLTSAIEHHSFGKYFLYRGIAAARLSYANNHSAAPALYGQMYRDLKEWKRTASPEDLEIHQQWVELVDGLDADLAVGEAEETYRAAERAEKSGNLQEAITLFSRFIAMKPQDRDGYLKRGLLYYQLSLEDRGNADNPKQAALDLSRWRDLTTNEQFAEMVQKNHQLLQVWEKWGQYLTLCLLADDEVKNTQVVKGVSIYDLSVVQAAGFGRPVEQSQPVVPPAIDRRQQQDAWIRAGRCEVCGGTIGFFDKLTNNRRCKQHR